MFPLTLTAAVDNPGFIAGVVWSINNIIVMYFPIIFV